MAAIASGQVTLSGGCADAGSDAAARVVNVKLKHCKSRMTCSHLPDSDVHQSSVSRNLPWIIAHGNRRPALERSALWTLGGGQLVQLHRDGRRSSRTTEGSGHSVDGPARR